jgi:hypothetical protein
LSDFGKVFLMVKYTDIAQNTYVQSRTVTEIMATNPEVPGSIPGHYREKKVVGLERGPISLVSATEELLGRNSSGSGLESREYGHRDSSR